jgi:hypothetical protein
MCRHAAASLRKGFPMLSHSPAKIVRQLLINSEVARQVPLVPWPVYALSEPESPDDVLTVFNTSGVDHGRLMPTGERSQHEGIQVRVRAASEEEGYIKSMEVAEFFDRVLRVEVALGDNTYILHSFNRTSPVISLGKESPESKRYLFTINGLLLVEEL